MPKKAKAIPKIGRESDKFMLRLPPGMRDEIAREADKKGRSMNAEIVDRLKFSFEQTLTTEGMLQVTKRLEAASKTLEGLFYEVQDVQLESFMADQRASGKNLSRSEAIRFIVRTWLSENGYMHGRLFDDER